MRPIAHSGSGVLDVTIAEHRLDRFVAALAGHRRAGHVDVVINVVDLGDNRYCFDRCIGGRRVATAVIVGEEGFVERLGPVELQFLILDTSDSSTREAKLTAIHLVVGGLRLKLPQWVQPAISVRVSGSGEMQHVKVVISQHSGRVRCSYEGVIR
jgi:Domain of unknown function (DUF4166)